MFIKNYHLIFFSTLLMGMFFAICSNSWFTCWLGLEINLMSMIPLILISLNKNSTEASIKYFLAQALASVVLIFSVSLNFMLFEISMLELTEVLILSSLSLKGGFAPFHFWFPQVSELLNWTQCLIIFTLQKITPILLMFSLSMKMTFFISVASAITGASGGFNQNLIKTLMAYSSITHSGWMLLSCSLSTKNWFMYFLIYSFLSFTIINFFLANEILKVSQIFSSTDSFINKNILLMNMLSLGGLPPLLGFLAKLSVILVSLKMKIFILFIPLILSSIMSLFFYTRMVYSSAMNTSKTVFNKIKNNKPVQKTLTTSSLILNILLPALILFN